MPEDLFALRADDGLFYLYAPLRRWAALVNAAAVHAVAAVQSGDAAALSPAARAVVRDLEHRGLLGEPVPPSPTFPAGYRFCPHEVTLFLTSRCNLRCRYCYANAGHKSVEMPWDVARAAIDLVATNAGLQGLRSFGVGFHGGGEPTVAWDRLVQCVEHARAMGDRMGLDAEVYAATNGVLSPSQREYIATRFTSLTVSLDGPADIQDFNRPKAGGGGSFAEVRDTLRHFDDAGFFYSVRTTITSSTVDRMDEIVRKLHAEFRVSDLHMEPAWACGRCVTTGERPPSEAEFVEHFRRAVATGRELGVHVHYSGARLDVLTSKFCAAPGDGFSVLPEGIVTSCYEVTEASDPRAATFHYGRYDRVADAFAFDGARLAELSKLSVENLDHCRACFCKWHCAGDCLAKAFQRSGGPRHEGSPRCNLNRELTRRQIADLVETARGHVAGPGAPG